jgi:hypothetical protein
VADNRQPGGATTRRRRILAGVGAFLGVTASLVALLAFFGYPTIGSVINAADDLASALSATGRDHSGGSSSSSSQPPPRSLGRSPNGGPSQNQPRQRTIYYASGGADEGATVVELYQDTGTVEQDFTTRMRVRLTSVAVRTSRDPHYGDPVPGGGCSDGSIGRVEYQVLDNGALLATTQLPACRDADTVWNLATSVILTPGKTYTLRIRNLGDTKLSVYFNANRAQAPGKTRLWGAVNPSEPNVLYYKAVSGSISAEDDVGY